ncbi:MAG TPA: exodeoxyribonuclease VII large subunit, partial [Acetobacteraceae bacterium]|nr:exodeoxyribonuclease VII large subunit [Acetobacteraceae bacterium]
ADRRAPTPTAAAELAVPVRTELLAGLAQSGARLAGGLHRLTQERRLRLERAAGALPDLPGLLGAARQRLDDRGERLALALPGMIEARRAALGRAAGRLLHPAAAIAAGRARVQLAEARLGAGFRHLITAQLGAIREAGARLEGLSPEAVLGRGYALVFDPAGRLFTRAREIAPGAALRLRLADGTVRAKAEGSPGPQGRLDL